ncbi:MAG: TIGR02266 family protein [Deltaproteobacteria bacterium]|nr:TIGR02266 family protein [Deltaproteobacteria bacterium]
MMQGSNVRARPPIELKVEYKKLNSFFADYTKNISKGGTFIRTERPLKAGTEFLFHLGVPQRAHPFVLHGRVTWAHGVDGAVPVAPGERGMGITFVFPTEVERRVFTDEVEGMMRASLGDLVVDRLLAEP